MGNHQLLIEFSVNAERVPKLVIENNNHMSSYSNNIISFEGSNCPPPTSTQEVGPTQNCSGKTDQWSEDMTSLGNFSFSVCPMSSISNGELYGSIQEHGPEAIKMVGTRTTLQAHNHLLAERKRRQTLSQRFIALSAIIPGLKKLDKASLLEGAIDYLKELEGRIKILEEEKKRKNDDLKYVNSTTRTRLAHNHDGSAPSESDYEKFEGSCDQSSPEVEVRTSDRDVLLRVFCNKRSGIAEEIFREIEKLDLCINSSISMPFGNTNLHITIIARTNGKLERTAQDLAKSIEQAVLECM